MLAFRRSFRQTGRALAGPSGTGYIPARPGRHISTWLTRAGRGAVYTPLAVGGPSPASSPAAAHRTLNHRSDRSVARRPAGFRQLLLVLAGPTARAFGTPATQPACAPLWRLYGHWNCYRANARRLRRPARGKLRRRQF